MNCWVVGSERGVVKERGRTLVGKEGDQRVHQAALACRACSAAEVQWCSLPLTGDGENAAHQPEVYRVQHRADGGYLPDVPLHLSKFPPATSQPRPQPSQRCKPSPTGRRLVRQPTWNAVRWDPAVIDCQRRLGCIHPLSPSSSTPVAGAAVVPVLSKLASDEVSLFTLCPHRQRASFCSSAILDCTKD